MYKYILKRLLDFVISFLSLLLLLPIFMIVIVILFITSKDSPFYLQPRIGKDDRIFKVIKLKTMNEVKDKNGQLLPDNERITSVGRFLRKTSLDELPQLFNVIKGDMSFVGPRPLLVEYLPLYNDLQKRRHEVRPGITGWAQVNGRNAISWEQKFEYDVWYVENLSFLLDMKIILLTINKVFKREGISSGTSVTMERFLGNNKIN